MTAVDPYAFRSWTQDAQRKALDLVHAHQQKPWHKFYCPDRFCDGRPHVHTEDKKPCTGDPYGHWWFKDDKGFYCDPEFGCGKRGTPADAWQFPHARADQRPPSWKRRWRTWAITSGRGGGKTETGARLTHKVSALVPRMIFVGATGPDFRELMVEGVSGILATAPPGKKPVFEPSKKKLTWPNGAVGIGYSAEEPDRLRGPQCLVAGTMIETETGSRPIEQVEVGERVWTRNGLRPVIGTASKVARVTEFAPLCGTLDHPIWTENRGWVRMDSVTPDDILRVWNGRSTEQGGRTATATASTTSAPAGSMSTRSARSLTATRFTTSTSTGSTTGPRTWWHSLRRRIGSFIARHPLPTPALAAAGSSSSFSGDLGCTAPIARSSRGASGCESQTPSALSGSSPVSSAAPSSEPETARSVHRRASTGIERVFDLTVAEDHEFFANGILVHNSGFIWGDEWAHFDDPEACWDNALFGMRLGNPSHVLLTSTPKPLPWLKTLLKDPRTIHTRVSTYANLYNLDAAYRELVIEKYEGTRKGRQELHGELLEDVEGALWDSDMIHWIEVLPEEFDRIVVAVDPAGSCNRRSDETGIIVCGWFDGEAYVLEDLSGKYSPKGWADKAWSAHEKWSADAIVAEKNYGGDMVKRNLEISIGVGLAKVDLVDSRRGKAIRAEPIVAQYEKTPVRVYHRKGKLEKLEDEQLSWIPGESVSPNRVDALVHGLTDLFKSHMPAAVSNPNEVLKHLKTQAGGIPGRNGSPWSN